MFKFFNMHEHGINKLLTFSNRNAYKVHKNWIYGTQDMKETSLKVI